VVDEMERSLEDALSVVALAAEDGEYVYGGGAIQMELALGLREQAAFVGGREQLAIEAFANALEAIPRTLAENAGMDPIDALIALRRDHNEGRQAVGVDPFQMKTADMERLGVVEPARIPKQTIASATDAAVMVLRIDDVIASKAPKTEEKGKGPEGMPPSGGFD
jgi:chaperonin GroEL (HSP60 family)